MGKIYTVNKKKSRFKKKDVLWAVFIVIIMTFSILGYMWNGSENEFAYGKYNFQQTEARKWLVNINKTGMEFDYHPAEVENIGLSKDVLDKILNSKMIYLTFDSNQTSLEVADYISLEFTTKFYEYFKIFLVPGVTKPSRSYTLPEVSCANATQNVPVLYFKQNSDLNETQISLMQDCIIVEGKPNYFIKAKDRLFYGLLGVIK